MKRPIVIYDQFDIVKVPFPFTDRDATKKRPALILSKPNYCQDNNHYILAMITSGKQSSWPHDRNISDLQIAGLPGESKVRFKIFSLDSRVIIARLGRLSDLDIQNVKEMMEWYW